MTKEEVRVLLNSKLYFDLAGWSFSGQWKGVVTQDALGVGMDRLLYGSDFPFTPAFGVKYFANLMDKGTAGGSQTNLEKCTFEMLK